MPKFIYTVPSFQNPGGVTLSLERRRRLVRGRAARASCSCSRTTRTGCCATRATRSRRCTRSTAASTSSTSGRSRRSSRPACGSGWTAAPRPVLEKMNLGKGGADLCSSSLTQHFVVAYFAERDWRRYLGTLTELYRRRRDTMLDALAEHFPRRGDVDAAGGRAVHLGDAARLHRHDRPAGAGAAARTSRSCPGGPRTSTAAAARRCG